MFTKITTLAVVATVALAMPTDLLPTKADIPVHADFPLPVVPLNFEGSS